LLVIVYVTAGHHALFAPLSTREAFLKMKNILIVDDESLILYGLSKTLAGDDRHVTTAANGHNALREIADHRYDLCLLDIQLPDMNGLEIMRTLRQTSPDTKIIIITGSEITDGMMKSIQENAHQLIPKPFDLDEVRTAADQVLARTGPAAGTALKDSEPFIQRLLKQVARTEKHPEPCGLPLMVPLS
jgi:CheY-like chemotaxis protein